MCFDARKPEAAPLMRAAAAERGMPERLRDQADTGHAAAALIERMQDTIATQGDTIERLRARLGECQRGRRGEGDR